MNSLETFETDSVDSAGAASSRNLIDLSQRERKRKNKLACGVFSLICIAGITIGFGFLFVQKSEFVQEKIHYSEAEAIPQIVPVAQAQQRNNLVFDLPTSNGNIVPHASTTTTGASRSATNAVGNGSQTEPANNNPTNTTKKLPDNAQLKHPVSLLYEMRLKPKFKETNCPNFGRQHLFKCVLTLDGNSKEYTGYGTKKKVAKKLAAQQACTDLYKLIYGEDPDLIDLAERCG